MTDTPPPRRALATFLRRAGTREQASAEAVPPADPAAPAAEDAGRDSPEPALAPPSTAEDVTPSLAAPAGGAVDPSSLQATPIPGPAPLAVTTPDAAAPAPEEPPRAASPVDESDQAVAVRDDTDAQPPAAGGADPRTAWQAATLPVAQAAAPTFARPRVRPVGPRISLWQWTAMIALALVLALQILLADRARLATDAQWRPLLGALCSALRCELPAWHEPSAFTMLDRDVRPANDAAGALRIQASFRNDARWSQDWPALQLSLSDADGRVIGTRVFSPTEYLGHRPGAGEQLAPGQSARIDFRVREPAAGTAAFTFEFH